MATTGIINGTLMRFTLDGDKVFHTTSCSLSYSAEVRDTASKDIEAGWSDGEIGTKSWTANFEGLFTFDTALNAETRLSSADLFALFDAAAKIDMEMLTGVTGDTKWSGKVLYTQGDMTFPNNENSTLTGSFQGAGPLTAATISA